MPAAAGWSSCPDGKTPTGGDCGMPPMPCAAGTTFFVGDTACTAVGPPMCAMGFAPAPGGWGCAPVVVAGPCADPTFEQLGSPTCVPVDDCAGAFPPAAATVFVSSQYTAAQVDATHKQHIADALAVAAVGATVAIDSGEYDEALTPSQAVTLVGRCAAQVTLRGTTAQVGVTAAGTQGIVLSDMTITGFEPGVSVSGGGAVEIDHCIVEGNAKAGVLATDSGTTVTVNGSALRANVADESARFGYGIAVGFGASATIAGSSFTDDGELGVFAEEGGIAKVSQSVIRRSKPRAGNNAYGWGIGGESGGLLTVTECDIEDVSGGGVVVVEPGTTATVTRVFTAATVGGAVASGPPIAGGVLVQLSASATIVDSTLSDGEVAGLYVSDMGTATLTTSAIIGVRTGGTGVGGLVVASGGKVTTQGSVVANNAQVGVVVAAPGELDGGSLYLLANTGAALAIDGKSTLSRLRIAKTANGAPTTTPFGTGIYVAAGASLTLDHAAVLDGPGLGILVAGKGATATLSDLVVRDTLSFGDASGFGLAVAGGGLATVTNAAFVNNRDISVYASDMGSSCSLTQATVAQTVANGPEGRGRGVNIQSNAHGELHGVAVLQSTEVGVDVTDGADLLIEDSQVNGSTMSVNGFGHGISAVNTGVLTVRRTQIENASNVGLVFGGDTGGIVSASVVENNLVGIYTQAGATLQEADAEPASVVGGVVVVTSDTQFVNNQTKVGSVDVPLPAPIMKSF